MAVSGTIAAIAAMIAWLGEGAAVVETTVVTAEAAAAAAAAAEAATAAETAGLIAAEAAAAEAAETAAALAAVESAQAAETAAMLAEEATAAAEVTAAEGEALSTSGWATRMGLPVDAVELGTAVGAEELPETVVAGDMMEFGSVATGEGEGAFVDGEWVADALTTEQEANAAAWDAASPSFGARTGLHRTAAGFRQAAIDSIYGDGFVEVPLASETTPLLGEAAKTAGSQARMVWGIPLAAGTTLTGVGTAAAVMRANDEHVSQTEPPSVVADRNEPAVKTPTSEQEIIDDLPSDTESPADTKKPQMGHGHHGPSDQVMLLRRRRWRRRQRLERAKRLAELHQAALIEQQRYAEAAANQSTEAHVVSSGGATHAIHTPYRPRNPWQQQYESASRRFEADMLTADARALAGRWSYLELHDYWQARSSYAQILDALTGGQVSGAHVDAELLGRFEDPHAEFMRRQGDFREAARPFLTRPHMVDGPADVDPAPTPSTDAPSEDNQAPTEEEVSVPIDVVGGGITGTVVTEATAGTPTDRSLPVDAKEQLLAGEVDWELIAHIKQLLDTQGR